MTSSLTSFCDFLDVTYSPVDCPYPELNLLLLGAGFIVRRDTGGCVVYVPPTERGVAKVTHSSKFAKVSLSGGVCASLRSLGLWDEALSILGTSPHKVTRLDAALDLPLDAADVIVSLRRRYPDGRVNLGRKALPVSVMLSTRDDGRESGTYYVGHRTAARMTCRVYDKSLEALSKRGEKLPTTTRFEVTARKDSGATLRDAAMPDALFWHIASPALLSRPEGIPMWAPNTEMGYTAPIRSFEPAETLRRRVESSPELEAFLAVADVIGDSGRDYLLSLVEARLFPERRQAKREALKRA